MGEIHGFLLKEAAERGIKAHYTLKLREAVFQRGAFFFVAHRIPFDETLSLDRSNLLSAPSPFDLSLYEEDQTANAHKGPIEHHKAHHVRMYMKK